MRYLHREDRKKKSKSISTPTSYHYYVKTTGKCHKLETTRCYKSLRIARRWFTGVPNNSGENSEPKYSWDSRFRAILNDPGTLAIEVKIPSQQSGNMKCWVRISRGIEQYARQFLPSETDHPNLEAAASQQSISCGRPRAQGIGGNSTVRYERCAKAKAYINCSQSTSLEIGPSNNVTQKGGWIRTHLPALHEHLATSRLSWIRRSSTVGSCFDKHAKCWANSVLVHRTMDWCTESFYWQTRNGVLWGSWRNDFFYIRASARTKSWCLNQSNFFFIKRYLWVGKNPCSTRAVPTIHQSWRIVSVVNFIHFTYTLWLLLNVVLTKNLRRSTRPWRWRFHGIRSSYSGWTLRRVQQQGRGRRTRCKCREACGEMWRQLRVKQDAVKHGWDGMIFKKHTDCIQQNTSILRHVHTTRKIACVARDRCARCGVLFTLPVAYKGIASSCKRNSLKNKSLWFFLQREGK